VWSVLILLMGAAALLAHVAFRRKSRMALLSVDIWEMLGMFGCLAQPTTRPVSYKLIVFGCLAQLKFLAEASQIFFGPGSAETRHSSFAPRPGSLGH
jgi:hypothetical protein